MPHHLSFGQRRRVAVATVLAMRPEILVLDEPSSNLDPASRRELAEILRSLPVTVLMVTHDLPYALELCPRSVILDRGRIVADGATRDLLADAELLRAPAGAAVRLRPELHPEVGAHRQPRTHRAALCSEHLELSPHADSYRCSEQRAQQGCVNPSGGNPFCLCPRTTLSCFNGCKP